MKKYLFVILALFLFSPFATSYAAVDINTASISELRDLPGVGQKTAEAIVAGRPYASIDDLKRVKGIGDAKLAKMRDQVTVTGTTAAPSAPTPAAAAQSAPAGNPSPATHAASNKTSLQPGEQINVNTASAEELDRLPGIGMVKAKAIIAGRPYGSVDDLTKVKGIKQATLMKIKPYVTVK